MFTMRPYFDRICVFLIVLVGNEVSGRLPWQSDFSVKSSICHSPECDAHATYLHDLLNHDINPCDDFYQYVCGKWGEKHPESDYFSEWGIDMLMTKKAFKRIKYILNTVPSNLASTELNQARALYEACTNIPYLGILDAPSLRKYIKVDHFPLIMKETEPLKEPKLSWFEEHDYYLSITGEPAFFSIEIESNSENNMKPQLRISRMESPFGLIEPFEEFTTHKLTLYKNFLLAIVTHLIPPKMREVTHTLLKNRLLDVLDFRHELSTLTSGNKPNPTDCHLMSMKTFDRFYPSNKNISWAKIIYSFYTKTDDPLSLTTMKICFEEKKYFDSLAQLLRKTDDDILVNHIHLYFIERHLKLTPELREMLMKVVIRNGQLEEKIRYLGKREFGCLLMSQTTDGFEKTYINKYFPSETKKQGELLVNHMKDVMGVLISQSTWLDANTMKKATDKISNMKMAMGYPEYYDDPKLRTNYKHHEEHVRVVTSDLFYDGISNRLSISAAYFNPPIYDPTFPSNVVYGTIGASAAHEMYHAFGPKFMHHKRLPVYWSKEMLAKYKMKTECFVEQFNNKPVKELSHIPNAPTIDGHRTLDENLSDSMGLNLAYLTFRKEIWTSKMCEILKGPLNFTCEQLFFVSFASSFCSTMTLDELLNLVQNEVYCPDRLRVNGAVSNLEEFSKAFNCPKAAPMNPLKRCNLWI